MNAFVPQFNRELKLSASIDELDRLQEWVEEILEQESCTVKACSQLAVVVEEVFVNIVRYAYNGAAGETIVRMALQGPVLAMQFEDSGKPFNPLEYPAPDIAADLEDRAIGGLGIYMTRKWMDDVTYERLGNRNLFTIYKKIREN
jgi:sigma-B regulation protein RsbU (phosphoserine phosphatase)